MQQGDRIVLVVPVGPVRVDASDRAELCTQALAGERAVVLNTGTKDWMHIQLESDGYTGWVDGKQWAVPTDDSGSAFILQAPFSGWLRGDGALMHYPAGSRLAQRCRPLVLNGNGLEPGIRWAELWRQRKMQSKQPSNSLALRTCGVGKRPLVSTAQGWFRWPGN